MKDSSSTVNAVFSQLQFVITNIIVRVVYVSSKVCVCVCACVPSIVSVCVRTLVCPRTQTIHKGQYRDHKSGCIVYKPTITLCPTPWYAKNVVYWPTPHTWQLRGHCYIQLCKRKGHSHSNIIYHVVLFDYRLLIFNFCSPER